jgi:hypothetical protein
MSSITTTIAADGQPASPAMAAALAAIYANGAAANSRQARIDADHRIIGLRRCKAALASDLADGVVGAQQLFAEIASGITARRARVSALIHARIQMLDGFPHVARLHLTAAAGLRATAAAEARLVGRAA